MKFVKPIKDRKLISQMIEYADSQSARDGMLLRVAFNTGFRIGDILKLKMKDFVTSNGEMREHIDIIENKTKKPNKIWINEKLKAHLRVYFNEYRMEPDDYVVFSYTSPYTPIGRQQAYTILKRIGDHFGIEQFSCHSTRKTLGYWVYKDSGHNLALAASILNHGSPAVTMRYIDVCEEEKDEALKRTLF